MAAAVTSTSSSRFPFPPAMAHLRRDDSGAPVPVSVPWVDDRPRFTELSPPRLAAIGMHGLCGVCGLALARREPCWFAVHEDELARHDAATVPEALRSVAPGGHLECVLFVALTRPDLLLGSGEAPTSPTGGGAGSTLVLVGTSRPVFESTADFTGFRLRVVHAVVRCDSRDEISARLTDAIAAAQDRIQRREAPQLWCTGYVEDEVGESAFSAVPEVVSAPRRSARWAWRRAPRRVVRCSW